MSSDHTKQEKMRGPLIFSCSKRLKFVNNEHGALLNNFDKISNNIFSFTSDIQSNNNNNNNIVIIMIII